MKIVYDYSHLGGVEILKSKFPVINKEIDKVISMVKALKTKKSKEKNKVGTMLYNPRAINQSFREKFKQYGFKEIRDNFEVRIKNYNITYSGFKQVDFVKDKIFIEVQLGKYAFMFYDMAKFQYFFNKGKAEVGVEIVPATELMKQMSSGVSRGESLIYDLERLNKNFPALPVRVILVSA